MSKDEISENLKVFRETLAGGSTREKAAQSTPTGKVLASSGFEVTQVENVAESQEHLVEEGVKRWRVKAMFRPSLAPANPPAGTAGGKTTVTPSGGSGKTAAPPTQVPPVEDVENTVAGGKGTGPSVRSAIGWGLAEFAINILLGLIVGPLLQEQEEQRIKHSWEKLFPKVQEDLNLRQDDVEKLLRQTNMQKTIYANVQMDMIIIKSC